MSYTGFKKEWLDISVRDRFTLLTTWIQLGVLVLITRIFTLFERSGTLDYWLSFGILVLLIFMSYNTIMVVHNLDGLDYYTVDGD